MKKTFAALAVLLAVVSGIMFTGCDRLQEIWDDVKDEFVGPQDKWQKCEIEYKMGDNAIKLNCYILYTEKETGYTNRDMQFVGLNPDYDSENESSKKGITVTSLNPGLTVCIQPKFAGANATESEASLVQQLFGTSVRCYAVKTFPKDKVMEDAEESLTINATTWTLLYNALSEVTGLEGSGLPPVLNKDVNDVYTNIEVDANGALNWKSIVAAMLVKKLLDE